MNRVLLTVLCLATMLTLRPAPGHASELTAVQLHEQGLTMLRKADFSGALQSFAAAMKADPQTIEHRQMAMLVNRALSVRAMFEETVDQQRWVQIAGALRTFYYDYQIYDEAMKLDRTVYETLGTPAAAVALAETMLVTEHDRDALGVLTKQDPGATRRAWRIAPCRRPRADREGRCRPALPGVDRSHQRDRSADAVLPRRGQRQARPARTGRGLAHQGVRDDTAEPARVDAGTHGPMQGLRGHSSERRVQEGHADEVKDRRVGMQWRIELRFVRQRLVLRECRHGHIRLLGRGVLRQGRSVLRRREVRGRRRLHR
jgi:hypothetical protein